MRFFVLAGLLVCGAAHAETPASAGPGRIICQSAKVCVVGIGDQAKLKYRIDITALPAGDQTRLSKQCTAKAAPCVATIEGTEMGDSLKIKAAKIKWYN